MSGHSWALIGGAVAGIAVLVALVIGVKLNGFLALMLAALVVGAGSGQPLLKVAGAFQDGMGATLGGVAGVIFLGVVLGKLLSESRGADVLARRMVKFFGPERVALCLMTLALAVGLTTWFAVGLFLLAPILQTLTRETGKPFLQLAIPMLACLSTMHGLMPPHPGPVVAIAALHADAGKVALWALVLGLPTAAISGPLFARLALRTVRVEPPRTPEREPLPGKRPPKFGLTLLAVLLPVALILGGTGGQVFAEKDSPIADAAGFIGNPTVALLIGVLFALWALGFGCGFSRAEILKITEEAAASSGMVVLIVGGGGGFAGVLKVTGAAGAVGDLAGLMHLPPVLYAWMVSAFIRVATGSATVAITTGAGLMAPVLAAHPGTHPELIVIALGCGALFLSHLNDSGFWLVKECLGMTVGQTLRTWTLCETTIGLSGLALTLLASWLV